MFLYTNKLLKEKTIPLTTASKRTKYLGINLTKEVKDLYTESYRHTSELLWVQFQNTTIKANIRIKSHEFFSLPSAYKLCLYYIIVIKGVIAVFKNIHTLRNTL